MKYIIALIILVPLFASAEVPDGTYFLMDNKGYGVSGEQTHFCLMDGNCYTVSGEFAFKREVAGVSTPTTTPTSTPTSEPARDTGTIVCTQRGNQEGDLVITCKNMYDFTDATIESISGVFKGYLTYKNDIDVKFNGSSKFVFNESCKARQTCEYLIGVNIGRKDEPGGFLVQNYSYYTSTNLYLVTKGF